MKPFVILSDVTCDLSREIREAFGVSDYVHGYVHFSNGRDFKTALDWDTISREEFYRALSNKQMKMSTAPASPEEYYEIFRKYAEDGYDILSMSISSKISSTYQVAAKAAARVKEEFPEADIYALDSLRMSGSFGLLTAYAHELQKEGKSMRQIVEWLEENKHRVHQMGPIDDLMFVARRGRISTGKAIMGSFAGVKPMGDCSRDGYVTVLAKVKGMKKALSATVAYIRETAENLEDQYVFIMHSNRETYANTLKEKIEAELHPKGVYVSDVFSASGTNIGPGMVGAYFLGAPISEDNEKEKETIVRAMESCRG
ncbi:MAG: DegV family protein [Clostridia bacterium]|nr:DegV family protein [Clostridia bacterium]